MTTIYFPLTIDRQDTLDIYHGKEAFSWWDAAIRHRWLYMALFAVPLGLSMWWIQGNADAILLLLASMFGVGYSGIEILRFGWKKREDRKRTNAWIDTFIDVTGHEIVLHAHWIAYRRADLDMVYRFADLQAVHRFPLYISIEPRNGKALVIPVKAFAPGDADRCWTLLRENFDHYLLLFVDKEPNATQVQASQDGQGGAENPPT